MKIHSSEINSLLKEKRRCSGKGDIQGEAVACNALGEEYARAGLYEEALEQHTRELHLCEAANDRLGVATAYRKLGERETERQRFEKAFVYLNRYLEIAEQERSEQETQRAHVTLGNTYLHKVNTEVTKSQEESNHCTSLAADAYQKSLELVERLKPAIDGAEYMRMKAGALMNLGLVYDVMNDIANCAQYFKRALQITEQGVGLIDTQYLCYNNLADLYRRHRGHDRAHKYYNLSLKCAEKLKDRDKQVDVQCLKALVHLQQEEYRQARRCFHRAYRLKPNGKDAKAGVLHKLKLGVKLEQYAEKLRKNKVATNERLRLCEKMGDYASTLTVFDLALKMYKEMLKCAETLGYHGDQLAPAIVSLAATCTDLKDYRGAVEYYRREIACRDDRSQIARSYLNIAECEDKLGEGYEQWKDTYTTALKHAEAAESLQLQKQILKDLSEAQSANGDEAGREETKRRLEALGGDEGSEVSTQEESEDEHTQGLSDDSDVDIDDLSCSEEDMEELESKPRARKNSRWFEKRNEKGETALHTACIAGNIKRVTELVEKGHPVNIRDFAGWLPLHEACNHGFPSIAQLLIQKGANVNDPGGKDCGKTTPLHDVCAQACAKRDFRDAQTHVQRCVDVIQLLVSNKANVHAKDDSGLTPLDYLRDQRESNSDVMTRAELLAVKQIEHLLEKVMKGNNPHLQLEICRSVLQNHLAELEEGSGDDSLPALHAPRTRTARKVRPAVLDSEELDSQIVESSSESEADQSALAFLPSRDAVDDVIENPETAPLAYKDCMQNMRRSAADVVRLPKPSKMPKVSGPALVTADHYVGDDWLEDDLRPAKRKRQNSDLAYFTTGSRKKSKRSPNSLRTSTQKDRKAQRKCSQRVRHISDSTSEEDVLLLNENNGSDVNINEMSRIRDENSRESSDNKENEGSLDMTLTNSPFTNVNETVDNIRNDYEFARALQDLDHGVNVIPETQLSARSQTFSNVPKSNKSSKQLKLTNFGALEQRKASSSSHSTHSTQIPTTSTQQAQTPQTQVQSSVIMKLRVRIKDDTIVVPIKDASVNMGWLGEEAARRYFARHTLKPVLSLTTSDGAIYSKDDLVTDMLAHNELVESIVESYNLTPLPERYSNACKMLQTVAYGNVKGLLRECDSSHSLALKALALRSQHFQPIARALHNQCGLRELHLQGNKLGDAGVDYLTQALVTLPSVTLLDLSCNQITANGLASLLKALESNVEKKPLQVLEHLDVSYNGLGDASTQTVARLLTRLPALSALRLQSCHLTMRFFQQHRLALADAFKGCNLRELDMSYNRLGCVGVELLLMCVRPDSVTSLDVTATVTTPTANTVTKHVAKYLLQEQCVLQRLVLDACHLLPDHIPDLSRGLESNASLQFLSISRNTKLTGQDVIEMLQACTSNAASRLQALLCTGTGLHGPLATDFIDAVNDKLQHHVALRELVLGGVMEEPDVAAMKEIWTAKWGHLGDVEAKAGGLYLSVSEEY